MTLNNELLVHVDLYTSYKPYYIEHSLCVYNTVYEYMYIDSKIYRERIALWRVNDNGSNDKPNRMGTTATTPSPQNTATQQLSIQSILESFSMLLYMYKYCFCFFLFSISQPSSVLDGVFWSLVLYIGAQQSQSHCLYLPSNRQCMRHHIADDATYIH